MLATRYNTRIIKLPQLYYWSPLIFMLLTTQRSMDGQAQQTVCFTTHVAVEFILLHMCKYTITFKHSQQTLKLKISTYVHTIPYSQVIYSDIL